MKRSYLSNIIKDTSGLGFRQQPAIKKFNPKKSGMKTHMSQNNHTISNFRSQNISMEKLQSSMAASPNTKKGVDSKFSTNKRDSYHQIYEPLFTDGDQDGPGEPTPNDYHH
jgi:hypothetical protein